MDDNTMENLSHKESNDTGNQKDKTNEGHSIKVKSINSLSHSAWQDSQKTRTRSRSRSPNSTKSSKQWTSSNAFINFVQDFRQNFHGMKSSKIHQLAGERWRQMPPEEKQPYLDAAKSIRNKKYNHHKRRHANMCNITAEQKPSKNVQKQHQGKNSKVKLPFNGNNSSLEQKKIIKKNNKKNTDTDTDSATSGTTCTVTSEDLSDTN